MKNMGDKKKQSTISSVSHDKLLDETCDYGILVRTENFFNTMEPRYNEVGYNKTLL